MIPDLGKYTVTVLAAWGLTLGLLAILVAVSVWRAGQVKRTLQAQQERMRKNG
ncbi:MAG TPA: heme exporter protein CcmD [Paenirhodobacter sp.]